MDLLKAMYKERRNLTDRLNLMDIQIGNKSEMISKTLYTDEDVEYTSNRIKEVEACIVAIKKVRQSSN